MCIREFNEAARCGESRVSLSWVFGFGAPRCEAAAVNGVGAAAISVTDVYAFLCM